MKKIIFLLLLASILGFLPAVAFASPSISYMQFLPGGQTCTVNLYKCVKYGTPTAVWQPITNCFSYVKVDPATNVATTYSHCVTTSYSVPGIVPDPLTTPNIAKAVLISSWTVNVPPAYTSGDGLVEQVNWKMGYGVSVDCGGLVS
jgi:hypothetical protein